MTHKYRCGSRVTGNATSPSALEAGQPARCRAQSDDGEPFEAKMKRLVAELQAQQAEGSRLDAAIADTSRRWRFLPREEDR